MVLDELINSVLYSVEVVFSLPYELSFDDLRFRLLVYRLNRKRETRIESDGKIKKMVLFNHHRFDCHETIDFLNLVDFCL